MKVERIYRVEMSEDEAIILKKILGRIDTQYFIDTCGVSLEDTEKMTSLYEELPWEYSEEINEF